VGAFLKGVTPLTQAYGIATVPKADVLVFNTNQCRDVEDWFAFYARHWNVPIVGVRSHRGLGEVKAHHVADVVAQFKDLIPTLERVGGHKFDLDRLRETVRLSRECTLRWRRVLELAALAPSPMTFFDHTIHMAPAVVLRGLPEAVEYYDLLLGEMDQRVADGIAAVPGERHRLYWEGMPVWGRLRMLSDLLSQARAAVVASTYCNSWIFDAFDEREPFESMARAYLELFIVRDDEYKERYIHQWVERFGVKGVIFHDAKTCPNNSNNRYAMPQRLARSLGLSTLVLNGDLNDLRFFSDEQTKTNLEAFVEQMEELAA
jgi:benzoyl-CoA reductase/2-hydroxyglutaryl-CoA dehydratase subunit BcrC/BadD/HgdB